MKLVVFSPVVSQSAIGRVAALVNQALVAAGHRVVAVRTENAGVSGPEREMHAEVLAWTDSPAVFAAISEADVVVYHIGNNFEFHEGAVAWLQSVRGVVCLHDHFLTGLFAGWCHANNVDPFGVVREIHGDGAAEIYRRTMAEGIVNTELVEHAPMTEWLCSMASALVTHSSVQLERIRQCAMGPVAVVPLAYDAPSGARDGLSSVLEPGRAPVEGTAARSSNRGTVSILTPGVVTSAKRIESVIAAIGSSELLRASVTYHVVGRVEARTARDLSRLARNWNVRLVLAGEVAASVLERHFRAADIVVALRSPVFETASAVAIEAMLAGRPLVVSLQGPNGVIPDECVMKVDMTDEVNDLRSRLELLASDPVGRMRMAANAVEYAARMHAPSGYASALVEIAGRSLVVAPSLDVLDDAKRQLARWGCSMPMDASYIGEAVGYLTGAIASRVNDEVLASTTCFSSGG